MRKLRFISILTLSLVLFSFGACKKKNNSANAKKAAVKQFKLVDNVSGIAATSSLNTLFNNLVQIASKVSIGLPITKQMLLTQTTSLIGLNSDKAIDLNRPVYLIATQKKPVDVDVIMPINQIDTFKKALPANKKPLPNSKNSFSYTNLKGDKIFVRLTDKWAIFTFKNPELLNLGEKQLALLNNISVKDHTLAVFTTGKVLSEFIVKKNLPGAQKLQKNVEKQIETTKKILQKVQLVKVFMDYKAGDLILKMQNTIKPGSELAKVLKKASSSKITLGRFVPENSWFVWLSNTEAFKELPEYKEFSSPEYIMDVWKQVLQLSPQDAKQWQQLISELMKIVENKAVTAVFEKDKLPFNFLTVIKTKQGKKAKELSEKFIIKIISRIIELGAQNAKTEEQKKMLTMLNPSSIKNFVDSINELWKNTTPGLSLQYKDFKINSSQGSLITLNLDYSRLQEKNPDILKAKAILGNDLSLAWGYNNNLMIVSGGANALEIFKNIKGNNNNQILKNILANNPGATIYAGYLSVGKLISIIGNAIKGAIPQVDAIINRFGGDTKLMIQFATTVPSETELDVYLKLPLDDTLDLLKTLGLTRRLLH